VTLLRKLLVLPLLTPVLMVLVLAAANPRPDLSLRLLTWRSPTLPLGTWLAIGAAGGLSLGAGASALAIAGARGRRPSFSGEPFRVEDGQHRRRRPSERETDGAPDSNRATAMPSRRAGEPSPTVTVPFRVIRRPSGHARSSEQQPFRGEPEPQAAPIAVGDDWGDATLDNW
jgi:hypothetical protein